MPASAEDQPPHHNVCSLYVHRSYKARVEAAEGWLRRSTLRGSEKGPGRSLHTFFAGYYTVSRGHVYIPPGPTFSEEIFLPIEDTPTTYYNVVERTLKG